MTDVAESSDAPFAGMHEAAAALENSPIMDSILGSPDEGESSPPEETTPPTPEPAPEPESKSEETEGPVVKVVEDPDLEMYGAILGDEEVEPAPEATGEVEPKTDEPADDAEVSADDLSDDSPIEWTTSSGEQLQTTIGEMKRGFLREGDYTQKTQVLAAERQDFETVVANVRQELESEFALVTEITNEVSEIYSGRAQKPSEELLQMDPDEYQRQKNLFDLQQDRWASTQNKARGLMQKKQQEAQAQQGHNVERQMQLLNQALPIMTDGVKGPKVRAAILQELVHRGYNDAEISATLDHRNIKLAHDAMLWRLSQDGKEATRTKLQNTPRMKKPGGSRDRSDSQREGKNAVMQRAASTNNMHDHANALLAIIG